MSDATTPRKVLLRIYTRCSGRSFFARVALVGEPHLARGGTVELQIVRGDTGAIGGQSAARQPVLMRRTIRKLLPGAAQEVAFPLSKLPPGDWSIRARFTDRYGQRHRTEVLQSPAGDRPEWFGSKQGVTTRVPPPWKPIDTEVNRAGLSVQCGSSRYAFRPGNLVDRVVSTGEDLLAGPVRLLGRAGGGPLDWTGHGIKLVAERPEEVVFGQEMAGSHLALDTLVQVEFDGMVRFDLRISPLRPTAIEALTLEIPLRTECVEYLFQFRGRCGDDRKVGRLAKRTVWKGFRPYLWLGDEERGLGWFAESDECWFSRDRNRVVEISRRDGAVILGLHLVSRPVDLAPSRVPPPVVSDREPPLVSELRYTFGLQATPVKPVEKDAWDYRIFCLQPRSAGGEGKLELPESLLETLVRSGIRTVVVFEHWTDVEAHTRTRHKKELKKIIRDCHARGLQVLFYFGFLFSDLAPERRDFAEECIALPKTGWSLYKYPPQPPQTAWRVCYRSVWQDFLVDGIARVMDEFDIDGVYLDGTAHPNACRNLLHGCGVLRPDGSIAPTFPIFAVRSTMRRIYEVVKSRKPHGQVNVHNSACMVTPTIAWATSTWDGEQFAGLKKGRKHAGYLPLDAFRTEFMGRQWGVPAEFLCYGRPLSFRQTYSFVLIHDVPMRGMNPDELELNAALFRVMDQYGRNQADWLPYWDNRKYVTVSPKGVCVSLYRHRVNGVLAVVSNPGPAAADARIRLKPAPLGLGGPQVHAANALTGDSIPIADGRLNLRLPPFGWKLIRVRPVG